MEEEIIELTPVKQSGKKMIIMISVAAACFVAAVAFLIMYILKPAATNNVVQKVNSVVITSDNDLFVKEVADGQESKMYASVGNEYTVYATVDLGEDVDTELVWDVNPVGAIKINSSGLVTNDVSQSAAGLNRFYCKFTPNVDTQSETLVTLTAHPSTDYTKTATVEFYVSQSNTKSITLSGMVSQDGGTVDIPVYKNQATNEATTNTVRINQRGEYNAVTDTYLDITSIDSSTAGKKTDDLDLELSSLTKGLSANDIIEYTFEGGQFKFRAKKEGKVKVNVVANRYNAADEVTASFTVNVEPSDSEKFRHITAIKFTDETITSKTDPSKVVAATTLNLVVGDTNYDLTDHLLIDPFSAQFDEKGSKLTDWYKNITVTSSDTTLLQVRKTSSAPFGLIMLNKQGRGTLTIKDNTTGAPGVTLTINFVILVRNMTVTAPVTNASLSSGESASFTIRYNPALTYESYKDSFSDIINKDIKVAPKDDSYSQYITVSSPARFASNAATSVNKFGTKVTLTKGNFSVKAEGSSLVAEITLKVDFSPNTPQGNYTLVFTKVGTPYGTISDPNATAPTDKDTVIEFNIAVTARASAFSFDTESNIENLITGGKSKVELSTDKTTLTLTVNSRASNTNIIEDMNRLFLPNIENAVVNYTFTPATDGVDFITADKKLVVSNRHTDQSRTYTVTAANSAGTPIYLGGDKTKKVTIIIKSFDAVNTLTAVNPSNTISYKGGISESLPLNLDSTIKTQITRTSSPSDAKDYKSSIPVIVGELSGNKVTLKSTSVGTNVIYSYEHGGNEYKLFKYEADTGKFYLTYDLALLRIKIGAPLNKITITRELAAADKTLWYNADINAVTIVCNFEREFDSFELYQFSNPDSKYERAALTLNPSDEETFKIFPMVTLDGQAYKLTDSALSGLNFASVPETFVTAASTNENHGSLLTTPIDPSAIGIHLEVKIKAQSAEGEFTVNISSSATVKTSSIEVKVSKNSLDVKSFDVYTTTDRNVRLTEFDFGKNGETKTELEVFYTITYVANTESISALTYDSIKINIPEWLKIVGSEGADTIKKVGKPAIADNEETSTGHFTVRLNNTGTVGEGDKITFTAVVKNEEVDTSESNSSAISLTAQTAFKAVTINVDGQEEVISAGNSGTITINKTFANKNSTCSLDLTLSAQKYIDYSNLPTSPIVKTSAANPEGVTVSNFNSGKLTISYSARQNGTTSVTIVFTDNSAGAVTGGNTFTITIDLVVEREIYNIVPEATSLEYTLNGGTGSVSKTVNLTLNETNYLPTRTANDIEILLVNSASGVVSPTGYTLSPVKDGNGYITGFTLSLSHAAVYTESGYRVIVRKKGATNTQSDIYKVIQISSTNTEAKVVLRNNSDTATDITLTDTSTTLNASSKFTLAYADGHEGTPIGSISYSLQTPTTTGVSVDSRTGVVSFANTIATSNFNVVVVASYTDANSGKKSNATYTYKVTINPNALSFSGDLSNDINLILTESYLFSSNNVSVINTAFTQITDFGTYTYVVSIPTGTQVVSLNGNSLTAIQIGQVKPTVTATKGNIQLTKDFTITVIDATIEESKWKEDSTTNTTINDLAAYVDTDNPKITRTASITLDLPANVSVMSSSALVYNGSLPSALKIANVSIDTTSTSKPVLTAVVTLDPKLLKEADYRAHTFKFTVKIKGSNSSERTLATVDFTLTIAEFAHAVSEFNIYNKSSSAQAGTSLDYETGYQVKIENTVANASYSLVAGGNLSVTGGTSGIYDLTLANVGSGKLSLSCTIFGLTFNNSSDKSVTVTAKQNLTGKLSSTNNTITATNGLTNMTASTTVYYFVDITAIKDLVVNSTNNSLYDSRTKVTLNSTCAELSGDLAVKTINSSVYLVQAITVNAVGSVSVNATVFDKNGVTYAPSSGSIANYSSGEPSFTISGGTTITTALNSFSLSVSSGADFYNNFTVSAAFNGTPSNFNAPAIAGKNITVTLKNKSSIVASQTAELILTYTINGGVLSGRVVTARINLTVNPILLPDVTPVNNTKATIGGNAVAFKDLFNVSNNGNSRYAAEYAVYFNSQLVTTIPSYDNMFEYTSNTSIKVLRHINTVIGGQLLVTQTLTSNDSNTIKRVTSAYITFDALPFNINFNGNDGNGNMSYISGTYGTSKQLSANSFGRGHYTFSGWATSSSGTAVYPDKGYYIPTALLDSDAVTLYAVWTPNKYYVTFDTNGGTIIAPEAYTYGNTGYNPTISPEKDYYTFAGWCTDIGLQTAYTPAVLEKDTILYAKWNAKTYDVKFYKNETDEDSTPLHEKSVSYGSTITGFPADPAYSDTSSSVVFKGWNTKKDGSGYAVSSNTTINSTYILNSSDPELNLYAIWGTNDTNTDKLKITFTVVEGVKFTVFTGNSSTNDIVYASGLSNYYSNSQVITVNEGNIISLNNQKYIFFKIEAADHYMIDDLKVYANSTMVLKYNGKGTAYKDYYYVTVTSINEATYAISYTAPKLIDYKIEYELENGTNHYDNPTSFTFKTQTITLQKPTREGYVFQRWDAVDASGNQITPDVKTIDPANAAANYRLKAIWEVETYSINTTDNVGNAKVTITSGHTNTIKFGETLTFTVQADTGYEVVQVSVTNGTISSQNNVYTVTDFKGGEIGIVVITKKQVLKVTTPSGANFTFSGVSTVEYGTDYIFTVTPTPNYLVEVTCNNGFTVQNMGNNTYVIKNVTSAITITVSATSTSYAITAELGQSDITYTSGVATGNTIYRGTPVTFTVAAKDGYTVTSVTANNGTLIYANDTYTLSDFSAAVTITVITTVNKYTLDTSSKAGNAIIKVNSNIITHGQTVTLNITALRGYTITSVTASNGNLVSGNGGTYTLSGFDQDVIITVTTEGVKYNFTYTAPNANVTTASGIVEDKITFGTDATFTVEAKSNHTIDTVTVNNGELEKLDGNTYKLTGFTDNVIVTVTTKAATFALSITASNATITILSGSTNDKITYGTEVLFFVTTENGYTLSQIETSSGTLTAKGNNVYSLSGFTQAVEITINTVANVYDIVYIVYADITNPQSNPKTYTYGVVCPLAVPTGNNGTYVWVDASGNVVTEIAAGSIGTVTLTAKQEFSLTISTTESGLTFKSSDIVSDKDFSFGYNQFTGKVIEGTTIQFKVSNTLLDTYNIDATNANLAKGDSVGGTYTIYTLSNITGDVSITFEAKPIT